MVKANCTRAKISTSIVIMFYGYGEAGQLFLLVYGDIATGLPIQNTFHHGTQEPGYFHIGKSANGQVAASFHYDSLICKFTDVEGSKIVDEGLLKGCLFI